MVRHSLQSQAVRSGKTAKERLIQMMLEEHTQCTPETLSCMEHDITKTISKYLPVSEKNICLYLKRNAGKILLFTVTELSAVKKKQIEIKKGMVCRHAQEKNRTKPASEQS